ncbi:MAG: DUF72 domain-containing protein [Gemmatimonadaceae bacterium]
MKILAGTSGFAFKEWKGPFYPADLKDAGMLAYYASRFPTVEINNTFYRMPKESVLLDWASKVPEEFTFAIKASQRITHFARLKPEATEHVEYLVRTTAALAERLGPILFQLPPNMKKDAGRLRAFLEKLPEGRRYAMEFRHPSWFDDETLDALREHRVAFVSIDQDDFSSPVRCTAAWAYLRLHRLDYSADALAQWAAQVRALDCKEAYVFFKHDHVPESSGSGPLAVDAFVRVLAGDAKD